MPAFDPNFPATNAALQSAPFRNQFNALHTEITAIPQGPPGPPGPVNLFIDENDPGGSDGDVWLRPSDGEVFRKEGGGWSDKGSLKGPTGGQGDKGDKGDTGEKGDKGDTGDVSQQQLSDGLATTALNINGVIGPFGGGFSDPPTQAEMQAFADYMEGWRQATVR